MAQQPQLPAEMATQAAFGSRSYQVAQQLSRIFHPIFMNIATFVIVGLFGFDSLAYGLGWAAACIVAQSLPPVLYYIVRKRQGAFSDADVSVRQQRNELYLFALATLLVGILVLPALGLPRPFLMLLASGLALGVASGLVNLFWKISAHAAAMASVATVALLYVEWLGILLWLITPLVCWARIRTRNHTLGQVVAGCALAAAAVLGVFWAMA